MPTVKEIVKEYLEKNGYGGLLKDECDCRTSDLFPCGEACEECKAGIEVRGCSPLCGEGCDWHIVEREGK